MITFGRMYAANFGPFAELVFEWNRPGLTLICGENRDTDAAKSNGSGKSHIIRCLIWTLFGDTIEPGNYSVVRVGAEKASASLEFSVEARHYRVQREQTKSRSKLDLFAIEAGVESRISGATQTATQAEIESLLGMDLDTMRATVVYAQNDRKRFADPSMTDKDRKAILKKAIRLEGLDQALVYVKKQRDDLTGQLGVLTGSLQALRAQRRPDEVADLTNELQAVLDTIPPLRSQVAAIEGAESVLRDAEVELAAYGSVRSDLETSRGEKRAAESVLRETQQRQFQLKNELAELLVRTAKMKGAEQEIVLLRTKIADLQTTIERLESLTPECEAAQRVVEETRKQRDDAIQVQAELSTALREVERQLALFALGKCPTCGTPTNTGALVSLLETLQNDRDGLTADLKQATALVAGFETGPLEAKQRDLAGQIAGLERAKADLLSLQRQVRVLEGGSASAVETEVADLEGKIVAVQRAEKAASNTFQGVEQKVAGLEAKLAEVSALEAALRAAQAELTEARVAQSRLEAAEVSAAALRRKRDEAVRLARQLEEQIAEAEAATARLQSEKYLYEFWVEGFGNTGVPSYMLDAIVDELAIDANAYLDILSDGDLQVSFDTQTTLKSGEMRDRFAVVVDVEKAGNVRPSGGQWRKIEIACDLALMDLVARRERASIDMLVLDECLDGLDAEGQARVVELLTHLRTKRQSIFVITHATALPDVFESVVTVTKLDGVATLN